MLRDYFSVDDNLATSEPVTEQSILDMFLGDGQLNDEEDVDDEDSEIIRPVCSRSEAKSHLEELHRYFEACTLTKDSDFSAISHLDNALLFNVQRRQCSINEFFAVL